MAQNIPQLIASARGFLTSQAYGSDERTVLIAIVDQLEKTHAALKPFANAGTHAIATACPDDRLVDMPPARASVWRSAAAAYQGEA